MQTEIIRNDTIHTVNKLECTDNLLKWSSPAEESYYLIVRSPFGKEINFEKQINEPLKKIQNISSGEIIELPGSIAVFIYRQQFILGYTCTVRPARYSIYVCNFLPNENKLTVYMNNDESLFCDISDCLLFQFERIESEKKGFWSKHLKKDKEERLCVKVSLKQSSPPGYQDGSLYYTFEGCSYEYPITKQMLSQGFFVPLYNGENPIIKSYSKGFLGKIE